jgi:hypothetical protein
LRDATHPLDKLAVITPVKVPFWGVPSSVPVIVPVNPEPAALEV